jgi:hypothetical protein
LDEPMSERWNELCDRWGAEGYESLSLQERVWLNTRSLIDSIENGGAISFFYNSGADTLADALGALDQLQAHDVRVEVERICELFPGGVPTDLEARNEIIGAWPESESESLDELLEHVDAEPIY